MKTKRYNRIKNFLKNTRKKFRKYKLKKPKKVKKTKYNKQKGGNFICNMSQSISNIGSTFLGNDTISDCPSDII
tara:strand:- start:13098 stop:13319 length:222 start_codon:yes stop_codon:yes gene_type:complete